MAPGQKQRAEQQRPGDHHQPVGDRLTQALAHGGGSVRRPDDLQVVAVAGAATRNLSLQMATNGHRTAFRTCPLCEATCGLEIELDGDELVSIRGDAQDVFSHGFICPKGAALSSCTRTPTGSARR